MFNRRISFLLVLSICFLLGMATKTEVDEVEAKSTFIGAETTPMMEEYESLIKPEEEPALYRTEIKQITPNSGITTGHVIAYGHYIKPPYRVGIKSDTMLFINGVQIFPVLPSKFEIEKKRREEIKLEEEIREVNLRLGPYFKRRESLFKKMRRVYIVIEPKMGRDEAVDSVLKIATTDTLFSVLNTTFVGKDDCTVNVEYFFPGDEHPTEYLLQLHGGDPSSGYSPRPARDINTVKEHVINMKEGTERVLSDQLVIFYTYRDRGFRLEHYLWETLEILKSDTLNMQEKIGRLSRIISENASKELLYNYTPSEWPTKKEDNRK